MYFLGRVIRFSGLQHDRGSTVDDLHEYALSVVEESHRAAAQSWQEGQHSGPLDVLGRACCAFLRSYFLQLGILDGMRGLVLCSLQSYGVYLEWSILWSWRAQVARGVEPVLPSFDEDEAAVGGDGG